MHGWMDACMPARLPAKQKKLKNNKRKEKKENSATADLAHCLEAARQF
jgi:hypothetical protein